MDAPRLPCAFLSPGYFAKNWLPIVTLICYWVFPTRIIARHAEMQLYHSCKSVAIANLVTEGAAITMLGCWICEASLTSMLGPHCLAEQFRFIRRVRGESLVNM